MSDHIIDQRRYLVPFRSGLLPQLFADVLVVGSGAAGLRAALASADAGRDVLVLSKRDVGTSSSAWAQGGIAAVAAPTDSVERHVQDTMECGAGLCDAGAVEILCREGPEEIERLRDLGMRFDLDETGKPSLGREGGHRRNRIHHTDGAATGAALIGTLAAAVQAHPRIRLFEHCSAIDLLTAEEEAGAPVTGALTHHERYGLQLVWSDSVIVAGGGAGRLYRETTNPKTSTGEAIAMAFRAGATVSDLEFVQFHPTTLYVAGSVRALLSEALRGEGARIIDRRGRSVMEGIHELGDLAPRDVVTARISEVLAETGEACVYLDTRSIAGGLSGRFPSLARTLDEFEIDADVTPIPIHPAAHYTIGGVEVGPYGESAVPGLFVCGEAANTRVHGANRLASNSLLEGLVFGRRAGEAAAMREGDVRRPTLGAHAPTRRAGELDLVDVRASLRSAMWRNVGIQRDGETLTDAQEMVDFWARYCLDKTFENPEGWEIQGMLATASLVIRGALARRESRGTHRRCDYPSKDGDRPVRYAWRRGDDAPTITPLRTETLA